MPPDDLAAGLLAFGLKPDEGSMRQVTAGVADHADWDKFEREARPSENIEDARKSEDTSLLGRILSSAQRASEAVNTGMGNALAGVAQYGEPQRQTINLQPIEHNPYVTHVTLHPVDEDPFT